MTSTKPHPCAASCCYEHKCEKWGRSSEDSKANADLHSNDWVAKHQPNCWFYSLQDLFQHCAHSSKTPLKQLPTSWVLDCSSKWDNSVPLAPAAPSQDASLHTRGACAFSLFVFPSDRMKLAAILKWKDSEGRIGGRLWALGSDEASNLQSASCKWSHAHLQHMQSSDALAWQ